MANSSCVPKSRPDWVMLDRTGRTIYYVEDDPDHKALKNKEDSTAVAVQTTGGLSGYFSFTLAPPPDVSYLDLHWPKGPEEPSWFPTRGAAYSSVLAYDKDLLLIRVAIPSISCYDDDDALHDLFVCTAAGDRPSLERLPLYTESPRKGFVRFCVRRSGIGILRRLAGDYVVADLIVDKPSGSGDFVAQLCIFFPAIKTRRKWRVFKITDLQPSDGGRFPVRWLTSTVLPFDGRFLCWVDYFSGILMLSGFSQTKAPAHRFLPFPGEQYSNKVRMGTGRCCPDRFRSLSVSQGMMCFVDIDNDFHERRHHEDVPRKKSGPKEITIWTLNVGEFEWEKTRAIDLETLWASYQDDEAIPQRLPEFPVISMDNPDHVWCLLREKEFRGKAWVVVVDMKHAKLHSCTPYVNDQPYYGENMVLKDTFANEPLLPTVFSKYLNNTTVMGYNAARIVGPIFC